MKRAEYSALDSGLWAAYATDRDLAATSGLRFAISFGPYSKLVMKRCHFCDHPGSTPVTYTTKRSRLGRINPLIGFVPHNCCAICTTCEKLKRYININRLDQTMRICRRLKRDLHG